MKNFNYLIHFALLNKSTNPSHCAVATSSILNLARQRCSGQTMEYKVKDLTFCNFDVENVLDVITGFEIMIICCEVSIVRTLYSIIGY